MALDPSRLVAAAGQLKPTTTVVRHTFVEDHKPDLVVGIADPDSKVLVGSQDAAHSRSVLDDNGITHILNVGVGIANKFEGDGIEYLAVELLDVPETRLGPAVAPCLAFICAAIEAGGIVLIHCNAGVSRSASVAIAYTMRTQGWSFDEALAFLRQTRPAARPNDGFSAQLRTGLCAVLDNGHA
eukprot:m.48637 g.48637  ORF g.48637 m.48637 type:complete len:184 (+) comp12016_c0_seq2:57-608(+)